MSNHKTKVPLWSVQQLNHNLFNPWDGQWVRSSPHCTTEIFCKVASNTKYINLHEPTSGLVKSVSSTFLVNSLQTWWFNNVHKSAKPWPWPTDTSTNWKCLQANCAFHIPLSNLYLWGGGDNSKMSFRDRFCYGLSISIHYIPQCIDCLYVYYNVALITLLVQYYLLFKTENIWYNPWYPDITNDSY